MPPGRISTPGKARYFSQPKIEVDEAMLDAEGRWTPKSDK